MMKRGKSFCMAAVCVLAAGASSAAEPAPFKIEPGPSTMTPEEAALLPDATGSQHAIVLLDDIIHDDTLPQYGRHVRVKVFSRDWRGIGDISFPRDDRSLLKRFWAMVIPPAGPAIELGEDNLVEQVVAKRYGYKEKVYKLALPRVSAGSVIDFGYLFAAGGGEYTRIPLQQTWDVRLMRHWWSPVLSIPSQYHVRKRPGVETKVTRGKGSIFLEVRNPPPFIEEPWSPPDDLIRAVAVLHYTFDEPNADPNAFWNGVAHDEEEKVRDFLKDDAPLRQAIADMALPAGASLDEKLRLVYAWTSANILNTSRLTAEARQEYLAGLEEENEKEKKSAYSHRRQRGSLADILQRKESSARGLDRMFIGIARILGARASLVLAADRTVQTWDRTLFNREQFDDSFVAVQAQGTPLEQATFVDPGSGLPYGVVDWRYTASRALAVTAEGGREVVIPHAAAEANLMTTRARLFIDPVTAAARVSWSAAGTGQRGMDERDMIRADEPTERENDLRDLCGESRRLEVTRAQLGSLEHDSTYSLTCEGDLVELAPGPDQQTFSARFSGAWIPDVPALVKPDRTFPVVWEHPWADRTTIDLESPQGFAPGRAPAPVSLTTPFGGYSLTVTTAAAGFHVERSFSMRPLTVKAEDYAALRSFLQQVRRADEIRLSFVRAGGPS